MKTYYILVNEAGVYVKEGDFFESQGGLTEKWGESWQKIEASNLYGARNHGIKVRRQKYPNCHKTMGEDGEPPESYWPEAKNQ